MAVDTRNKRASCIAFSLPRGRVYPNPDGDLATKADRQQTAFSYSGIDAAAGGGISPNITLGFRFGVG
ncbi:MAG TPA: hypothetical protein PLV92_25020 [Pirellulaceae bacterium]|nr:hypothetical protein [Pirellulaceae bacterium]